MTTDPELLGIDPDPVQIRRVYPSEVTVGEVFYPKALTIVTRVGVFVWTSAGGGDDTPTLQLAEVYDPAVSVVPREHLLRQSPMTLVTAVAGDVVVRKGRGCGCGSRLSGFHPFTRSGA